MSSPIIPTRTFTGLPTYEYFAANTDSVGSTLSETGSLTDTSAEINLPSTSPLPEHGSCREIDSSSEDETPIEHFSPLLMTTEELHAVYIEKKPQLIEAYSELKCNLNEEIKLRIKLLRESLEQLIINNQSWPIDETDQSFMEAFNSPESIVVNNEQEGKKLLEKILTAQEYTRALINCEEEKRIFDTDLSRLKQYNQLVHIDSLGAFKEAITSTTESRERDWAVVTAFEKVRIEVVGEAVFQYKLNEATEAIKRLLKCHAKKDVFSSTPLLSDVGKIIWEDSVGEDKTPGAILHAINHHNHIVFRAIQSHNDKANKAAAKISTGKREAKVYGNARTGLVITNNTSNNSSSSKSVWAAVCSIFSAIGSFFSNLFSKKPTVAGTQKIIQVVKVHGLKVERDITPHGDL